MDNNAKYLIELLYAFVNGQPAAKKKDINWEEVYKLSRIHSVSGILYLMVRKMDKEYLPNKEMLDSMKKDFKETIVRSAAQEEEIRVIVETLNAHKIPHAFVKGAVMRNYYPVKEMRTMGDIDFLIKEEDRDITHRLIMELGYEANLTDGQVWDYSKDNVKLEIHTNIMYRNFTNKVDYVSYYSDAWSSANQQLDSCTYEFKHEYHLVYLLVHLAKHVSGPGAGIRMIMDIAMCIIYFGDILDWNYINTELNKLELEIFSENIFALCNIWFGIKVGSDLSVVDESFYEDLSEYIISAGTFGFHKRNIFANVLRKQYTNKSGFERAISIIKGYKTIIFPSYEILVMNKNHSYIKNRPFLLPAAWIHRAFRVIFKKNKVKAIINIKETKKQSEEQYEIVSKLGL